MRQFFMGSLSIGLIWATMVQAQDDRRDQRRQFVEGILKTLVESQLKNQPQPPPGSRSPVPDPRLRDAHATLRSFSEESSHLIAELRQEEHLTPGLRPILSDVLRVKAMCDVLVQRAPAYNEQQLAAQVQQLDRDWRVVSHRLRQIPGLNQHCIGHINKLNADNAHLCELLRVEPQLDRTELVRLTAILEQDLRHLLEDIAIDLRGRSDSQDLLGEGRRLTSQIRAIGLSAASNVNNATIVGQYREFYERWRRFATGFRSVGSPHIERVVRSIAKSNNEIHDLLWLSREIDRNELLALTKGLANSVQQLCQAIPLSVVIELPDPLAAVADSQELLASCRALVQSVGGSEALDDLVWDFRLVEVEWQQVLRHFQTLKQPEVNRQLAISGQTIGYLRETLGQELVLDYQTVVAMAAGLDELTDVLQRDVARYLATNRHPPAFRAQALQSAQTLQLAARRLHNSLAAQADEGLLRSQCAQFSQNFEQFTELVAQFEEPQRDLLNQKCNRARPEIAKLQLLYGY